MKRSFDNSTNKIEIVIRGGRDLIVTLLIISGSIYVFTRKCRGPVLTVRNMHRRALLAYSSTTEKLLDLNKQD